MIAFLRILRTLSRPLHAERRMNPAELTAVEARRLIGARELSSLELVEACIAQIERIDPAVNAMVVRADDRARQEARDADAAVRRGEPLGALHGLPVAIKDIQDTAGIRTTYGSETLREQRTCGRLRHRCADSRGWRNRHRQDQRAGVQHRREHSQSPVRRHGQSVRRRAHVWRLIGRFGRCGCDEHGAARHGLRSRRQPAHSCLLQRRGRVSGDAWRRAERTAHDHADQLQRAGADGAHGGRLPRCCCR